MHFVNRTSDRDIMDVLQRINKASFYCYLFLQPVDRILRFDILWATGEKYLLKETHLDNDYKNSSEEISATVHDSISNALGEVILRLRNSEIRNGVYENLKTSDSLNATYKSLIIELEEAIVLKHITAFSMFGHLCKFRPQATAINFIKSLGHFILATRPPHVYVLDDYVKKELQQIAAH
jgi:hypothetical protein